MDDRCSRHRLRGGSWASFLDEIRSATNTRSAAADRVSIIGFQSPAGSISRAPEALLAYRCNFLATNEVCF